MSFALVVFWPFFVFGFGLFIRLYFRWFWPRLNANRFSVLFLTLWIVGLVILKWDGQLSEKLGALLGCLAFGIFIRWRGMSAG